MEKIGYIPDEPKEEDYIFGSALPMIELQPDGDWTPYLPTEERQNKGMESYACVAFTILTCIEILIKKQYGVEKNYSDRFLSAVSGTKERRGNSPRTVADFLRKLGVPPEKTWGYVNDYNEYYQQIPEEVYNIAKEFTAEFEFNYEYVPLNLTEQALKCSPLLVSVPAWFENDGLYYRPKGVRDTHATTLFKKNNVFDSYRPFVKEIGLIPETIMRFRILKRTEIKEVRLTIIEKLKQIITLLFAMLSPTVEKPVKEVKEPEEKKDYIKLFATAIQEFEGFYPGSKSYRNNNPGNIKDRQGNFMSFSTYEEGFDYLQDYLYRACTGQHKAYRPDLTIRQFVQVYAPSSENSDASINNYTSHILTKLEVLPSTQLKDLL